MLRVVTGAAESGVLLIEKGYVDSLRRGFSPHRRVFGGDKALADTAAESAGDSAGI